jgi:hypothetical protein
LQTASWPATNAFAATSFWNQPLSPTTPLAANSQNYVAQLQSQVTQYGPWMNTTSYSDPVYVVPAGQATQVVTLDAYGPDLQAAFDAVPIPTDAQAAAGSDQSMTVWQPSTDRMWEFWLMHKATDGTWHATWGGEMDNVSTNPGYFQHIGATTNWGATATGLPLLGGLVTFADLKRGYINHALAMALPQTLTGVYSWPAQRTDGSAADTGSTIPQGTRFRLDPTLDIASLNLPPFDQMLAHAAQTYGIVIRDGSGSVSLYGQDPTTTGTNPWPAAIGGAPNVVLAQFPWSHLQTLQMQLNN